MEIVAAQGPQPQQSVSLRNKEIEKKGKWSFILNNFFQLLFYLHLLLIFILELVLTFHGLVSSSRKHRFDAKNWYLQVLSSTALAGILGYICQTYTTVNANRILKAAFWLSPLLTIIYGVLLVSIGTPVSVAASAFAILSSILQALYSCWVTPRFENAVKILKVSSAYHPTRTNAAAVAVILFAGVLYSSFLLAAIGGASAANTKSGGVFILLLLVSFIWTMQLIKNMIQVTVSHIKYLKFANGEDAGLKVALNSAVNSMESICIGSISIPVLVVLRGLARGVRWVSGDVDEFMFSCTSCCAVIGSRAILYANRWCFVHVGVYNKGIVQASSDTWEIFERVGIQEVIDSDLTSAFCFFCGTSVGSACGIMAGSWARATHEDYAAPVSIYAFLAGYFLVRVAMAWIQASVTAYYVAYAENPRSQQFDNTIPNHLQWLQRSRA
ncbi:hypothetical protein M569_16445 [Genlisea aurea]|uniref:Choline transporter-like protein n=1 Tax=Genlisea aurea TaxID=192259 RepID=S8BUY7_9LAMI|nr:hypothetical protein M569_16445 [Genlisea aurea]